MTLKGFLQLQTKKSGAVDQAAVIQSKAFQYCIHCLRRALISDKWLPLLD